MKTKVLVLDDDDGVCAVIEMLLARRGCEVIRAADGRAGLQLVRTRDIDLVITDVLMPNQDGLETLLNLKHLRPQLPVVVMSGGLELEPDYYLKVATLLGAARTLQKPFNAHDLFAALIGLVPELGPVEEPGRDRSLRTDLTGKG